MGALKLDIIVQPPDEDCRANSYAVYPQLIRTVTFLLISAIIFKSHGMHLID
jgi:hypothetical protein